MLDRGATTTWEAWDLDLKWNTSLLHPAGSMLGYLLVSRVLGVRPTSPGFRTVEFAPLVDQVEHVDGVVPTPRGPIGVQWSNGRLVLELPAGVCATISAQTRRALVVPAAPMSGPGRHELTLRDAPPQTGGAGT